MGMETLCKFGRFLALVISISLITAFLLLATVPDIGRAAGVSASVIAALLVAMYDFGLFDQELRI